MPNPTIVTEVTYDELVVLITANLLNVGLQYELAFQTKHYMVDGLGNIIMDTQEPPQPVINTGAVEHLILTATSANTISQEALSVEFPMDIIHYDWNPANWLKDVSFGGASIVDGFSGVISFRHDRATDVCMGYDFRNVKFRRWNSNLVTMSSSDYLSSTASASHVISAADYIDVLTFSNTAYYLTEVCSVKFESGKENTDQDHYAIPSILLNNVFFLDDQGGWLNVANISFGFSCYGNTFGGIVKACDIGTYFADNIVAGNFRENNVGVGSSGNIFKGASDYCLYGSGFCNNVLGNEVSYCSFGSFITFLQIGDSCMNNNFESAISYIVTADKSFGTEFKGNVIRSGIKGTSEAKIDLSLGTHVYADYSCEIIKTSTGTIKLKYIDGSDNTEKIVAATA